MKIYTLTRCGSYYRQNGAIINTLCVNGINKLLGNLPSRIRVFVSTTPFNKYTAKVYVRLLNSNHYDDWFDGSDKSMQWVWGMNPSKRIRNNFLKQARIILNEIIPNAKKSITYPLYLKIEKV